MFCVIDIVIKMNPLRCAVVKFNKTVLPGLYAGPPFGNESIVKFVVI